MRLAVIINVAVITMTSALMIDQKEGIRVGRFVKETYGCNQLLKDLSNR